MDIIGDRKISIEETKQKFDKNQIKVKFKAFGKVTLRKKYEKEKKEKNKDNKETTDEEVAIKLREEQIKQTEVELKK